MDKNFKKCLKRGENSIVLWVSYSFGESDLCIFFSCLFLKVVKLSTVCASKSERLPRTAVAGSGEFQKQ